MALQRLEEGTYSLSEVSGHPIALERLEALPSWATTTVEDPVEH
jgi:RNA polymerase-binding transcription factor DksA